MRVTCAKENIARPRTAFLSVACFIMLMQVQPGVAGQREFWPAPGDYAVEITDGAKVRSYTIVPAADPVTPMAIYSFSRIPGWQRPPDQQGDPTAVQLKCRRESNQVRIDVSLAYGRIEGFRTLPEDGLRGQSIGSYSAGRGETVTIQELTRFGIEPISVKVVSARIRALDVSSIVNKTKSLELVRAQKERDAYVFEVKNISSKHIVALRTRGGTSHFAGARALIAPGERFVTGYEERSDGWKDPLNPAPDPAERPRTLVADVVFQDLTFEGDKAFALETAASRRGQRAQWGRMAPLLKEALAASRPEGKGNLENLRQQISALSEEVDYKEIDELARHFSPVTTEQRGMLVREMKGSLRWEKAVAIGATKIFESEETTKGTSRESWLKLLIEAYEEGVGSR